jgi:hypothetical protein
MHVHDCVIRIEKPIRCVCHGPKGGFSIYFIPLDVKFFWQKSGVISMTYVIYDIRSLRRLYAGKRDVFVVDELVKLYPGRPK